MGKLGMQHTTKIEVQIGTPRQSQMQITQVKTCNGLFSFIA